MKKLNWHLVLFYSFLTILSFFIGRNVENSTLNNFSMVSAVGIDQDEENIYHITLQFLNPPALQRNATGDQLGAIVYEERGRTISEAIRKLSKRISRSVFLDNTDIIVVSEELARKGITEVVDFLILEPNISANLKFFVTKDVKPSVVLQMFTPVHKFSASRIKETIENIEANYGSAKILYPNKIKNYLMNKVVVNTSIPYLIIQGDPSKGVTKENISAYSSPSQIIIGGMGFFNGDKLIDFLDDEEGKTLLILEGDLLKKTIWEATCPKDEKNKFAAMNITDTHTKLHFKQQENHTLAFTINSKVVGEIYESNCNVNFEHPNKDKYEEQFENEIKQSMKDLIEKSQEYNTDFIGFAKNIYMTKPSQWHNLKNDWNSIFPNMTVDVNVEVNITDTGESTQIPK
ncbi:Ger(x)C family spore germination protein [Metabacillus halosaccharovorans]|uniref:Ger(x)C family spore germination protein n=1 Tax=Metabacillus halosaccharovorans TaxID=930124 RepID=UPI000994BAEB|nr:Ger(x)C family spore germination protein [Metabacillus halosaccharovorans]